MKYCEEYGTLLDAYVDGELSSTDTLRVAEHLKTCGGCRSYVDAALAIRAAFPDEEDEAVPEEFAAGVLSAVREGKAPRGEERETSPVDKKARWKKLALPLAACLALAVVAGQWQWFSAKESFQASAAMTQDAAIPDPAPMVPALAAAPAGEGGGAAETRSTSGAADENEKRIAGTEEAVPEAECDASDDGGVDEYQYVTSSDRAENALSAAPVMNDANAEKEHAISVTLTQEQGDVLAPLLSDCTLESSGEDVVYLLTAGRFHEILAELERQNIPASVTEASDGAPYRLYIRYRAFS